ncbi:phage SPO1 DNA polymerase-related protein [Desulfurobacterium thermolithotrophum DSM 11699]|uniref:Type-4 uracil-DNA glycosylase n=1 Tax=Desulfurobacterium thermolithotrophum (strain DSM 11699 / BSA) TaxID=868864 RepID=F0S2M2_DESTD|nr:uracil-DNA glycosylase [Desulfurobacterium thermolithotrophum]ADY73094.1 phage SPO1 DNA polymerase-related protein [Desulfurobacterium thermolithotrophum DSM 11699]
MSDIKRFLKFLELIGYDEVRLPKGELLMVKKEESSLQKELEKLKEEVLNCCKCRLCKTRTNVVFGEGDTTTNLMFIGEAPGEQEDLQGRPFVGRAGQLLTRFLNLYGISRDKIFITNVVKCRPPGNRNPAQDEIKSCYPFLEKQIEIIKPKVILCLGAFAARTILNLPEKTPISRIRGKEQKLGEIVVIPTFHPAYLLRNRKGEPEFQKDLELALRLAGFIK